MTSHPVSPQLDTPLPDDMEEVLSVSLEALYGRASPAVLKQALDVLDLSYGGDRRKFTLGYLEPALSLLRRLQEVRLGARCLTWPQHGSGADPPENCQ